MEGIKIIVEKNGKQKEVKAEFDSNFILSAFTQEQMEVEVALRLWRVIMKTVKELDV